MVAHANTHALHRQEGAGEEKMEPDLGFLGVVFHCGCGALEFEFWTITFDGLFSFFVFLEVIFLIEKNQRWKLNAGKLENKKKGLAMHLLLHFLAFFHLARGILAITTRMSVLVANYTSSMFALQFPGLYLRDVLR